MFILEPTAWCSLDNIICAEHDEIEVDGTFIHCFDCHNYLEINHGKATKKSCPNIAGWGFNSHTKKCELRSPHCFACNGGLFTLSTALSS